MAVADDEAELKEAHTRDIITFSSMYFLGDYGAKAMASHLEKKTGVELLNKTYDSSKNKGMLTKFKNWVLNTHLKSSDELKGVGAELEKAVKLRAKCQMANLGTSLAILGVIVPIYTRLRTKKHEAEEKVRLAAAQNKVFKPDDTSMSVAGLMDTFPSVSVTSRGFNQKFPMLDKFKMKVETSK